MPAHRAHLGWTDGVPTAMPRVDRIAACADASSRRVGAGSWHDGPQVFRSGRTFEAAGRPESSRTCGSGCEQRARADYCRGPDLSEAFKVGFRQTTRFRTGSAWSGTPQRAGGRFQAFAWASRESPGTADGTDGDAGQLVQSPGPALTWNQARCANTFSCPGSWFSRRVGSLNPWPG